MKWTPPVRIKILEKDEAIVKDIEDEAYQDIVIYSDSSGHNGKIGGAAILCRKGIQIASFISTWVLTQITQCTKERS